MVPQYEFLQWYQAGRNAQYFRCFELSHEHLIREKPTLMPFCHIWYNDTHAPVVSQVNGFGKVDARLGGYPNPEKRLLDSYLLSCDVPEAARHRIPVSVSLLTTECPGDEAASNNLRIFSKK